MFLPVKDGSAFLEMGLDNTAVPSLSVEVYRSEIQLINEEHGKIQITTQIRGVLCEVEGQQ